MKNVQVIAYLSQQIGKLNMNMKKLMMMLVIICKREKKWCL